jgi:hypothetical protein
MTRTIFPDEPCPWTTCHELANYQSLWVVQAGRLPEASLAIITDEERNEDLRLLTFEWLSVGGVVLHNLA